MEVVHQPLKEIDTNTGYADGHINKKPRMSDASIPTLQFAKLSKEATTPTRGSELAAGFDLYRYFYQCFRIFSSNNILHIHTSIQSICSVIFEKGLNPPN